VAFDAAMLAASRLQACTLARDAATLRPRHAAHAAVAPARAQRRRGGTYNSAPSSIAIAPIASRSARLAYPIRDGIPIMLPDEARVLDFDKP
jgi:uncharacterized protein YbaR (Trm112 family)